MKTFRLSDGTEVPWITFGTGTAFYKKGCKDAVELALSMGFNDTEFGIDMDAAIGAMAAAVEGLAATP